MKTILSVEIYITKTQKWTNRTDDKQSFQMKTQYFI